MPIEVLPQPYLRTDQIDATFAVATRAQETDGVSPLNDDARLTLNAATSAAADGAVHLLATDGLEIIGYAQVTADWAVLFVDPPHRRAGVGRLLLDQALASRPSGVGVWSFHALPAAAHLATVADLEPVRELLVMQLDLGASQPQVPAPQIPPPEVPDGLALRTFTPGTDDAAWLAVNAAAFAHHPEQGSTTAADLADRIAEPWFRASDFLLAVDSQDRLQGFHWMKRHGPDAEGRHVAEVYVLGVDPGAGGRGLGTTLLSAGLRHLRQTGIDRVILYVAGAEAGPVHLYTKHGFTVATRDVMYAPRSTGTASEISREPASGHQERTQQS